MRLMKKWLLCSVLFATLHLQGLYQSNPILPEIIDKGFFMPEDLFMGIRIGYQHDQVFNRNLKKRGQLEGNVSTVSQMYDQGVLTMNFWDRVDVFASLGAMSIYVSDRQKINTSHFQLEYQTSDNFTWGTGLRAAIINWKSTVFGASANYQYANPKVNWNTVEGLTFSNTAKVRWSEWQVGVAVAQQIDIFTPYIGVNYSKVSSTVHNIAKDPLIPSYPTRFKMKSRNHFGMALGCDFSNEKYFDLGIEMQLISERAFTIKADIRF